MARGGGDSEGGKYVADYAGELAGLVAPGFGTVAKWLTGHASREWERNRSVALHAAEQLSGMTREEIGEAVAEDPRLVPLVTRLLHTAGTNGHDRTLKAMGAAFGDAVRHRDAIDECELILTSLADLTDAHTVVLLKLTEDAPYIEPYDPSRPDQQRGRAWQPQSLQQAVPLPSRVTALCAAALVARGLVRVSDTYAAGYELTELGVVLLEVLEQYVATPER
jgi:hypothetical protein